MTKDDLKLAGKVWDKVAEREGSLPHVLSVQMSALRNDPTTKFLFGDIVGDTHANKPQRTYFLNTFYRLFPHAVFLSDENGRPNKDKKPTAIVWVKVDKDDLNKMNRAFMSYRRDIDSPIVEPEQPVGHITDKEEVAKQVEFVHPSGYKEMIDERDESGELITMTRTVYYVPRVKTVWGHTKQVKDVFMKTIEYVSENPMEK